MNVTIPYEDFIKFKSDSAKIDAVASLLSTTFPDDTCQMKAIKAVLGIQDAEPSTDDEDVTDDTTTGSEDSTDTTPDTTPEGTTE